MQDDEDAFLDQFIRKPGKPLPDWAIKDLNNIYDELKDLPFFMKDLPTDPSSHPELAAFQAMLYEGTPEEIATNFKNQGNEAFAERIINDALLFYTRGLEVQGAPPTLTATLFLNRSAAFLEVGSYSNAVFDALEALKIDNSLVKGYYRCAKALCLLGRPQSALKYTKQGLELAPDNSLLLDLEKKLKDQQADSVSTVTLPSEIARYLKQRGIKIIDSSQWSCSQIVAKKEGDSLSAPSSSFPSNLTQPNNFHTSCCLSIADRGTLVFTVALLYPPYGESDFIAECSECSSIADLLLMVFGQAASEPAPWDSQGLYRDYSSLQVYYESFEAGVPLGNKIRGFPVREPLTGLVEREDFVLLDGGVCHLIVVPRGYCFDAQQYTVIE